MKTLPFWMACISAFSIPFLGALGKGLANPSSDRLVTIVEAMYYGMIGLSSIGFNKLVKQSIERKGRAVNGKEEGA